MAKEPVCIFLFSILILITCVGCSTVNMFHPGGDKAMKEMQDYIDEHGWAGIPPKNVQSPTK